MILAAVRSSCSWIQLLLTFDCSSYPGWREYILDGRPYYYHPKLGNNTQWDPPAGWHVPQTQGSAGHLGGGSARKRTRMKIYDSEEDGIEGDEERREPQAESPARQVSARKRAKEAAVSTMAAGRSADGAGRSRVPQVGDVVECEIAEPEAPDGVEWLPGSVTWVDARTKKMKVLIQDNEDDEEYKVCVCCSMANAVCPRAFAPCTRAERGKRALGATARG